MDQIATLVSDPSAWAALATLVVMEIVLGIDNLIFIAILTNKLPEAQRSVARRTGIGLAVVIRLALLSTVSVIARLTDPVFSMFEHAFSWRDMILIAGGAFLLWKATKEIHHTVDSDPGPDMFGRIHVGLAAAVGQIVLLDIVFSIDSIVTAVGMTNHIPIMVLAVLIAVGAMLVAADPLGRFIAANPSIVMLALGFLMMIGMALIAEGFGAPVPKGYIYAAMGFSAFVEGLNMLSRKAHTRSRAPEAQPPE